MRRLKIAGIALALLAVVAGGLIWRLLRADDIPATLEAAEDPMTLSIPGIGSQPTLDAGLLKGKTTFFIFVGIQSWSSDDGKPLNRALNRWTLPPGVQGFIIFDAEGLGFLAEKSEEYMERFGGETRFPMYGDFEGAFRQVFKMPQGHHGFVVVNPEEVVSMRKSGGAKPGPELAEIRALLEAEEPAVGPPVPSFALGSLSDSACAEKPCALVFLGESIGRKDIPGVDDGFEGEDEAKWAQMQKPGVRNVGSALKLEIADAGLGVISGQVSELEFPPGWSVVKEDASVRKAFGIEPGETSFLILREGEVAFRGDGVIPMYELGRVSDLLGVEFDFE
ncbi:MAG: hypothetical protein KUG77_05110 [Nannocystaceae bacterium]|nr:hypothetical protein [Nannocystaceae bacterium]